MADAYGKTPSSQHLTGSPTAAAIHTNAHACVERQAVDVRIVRVDPLGRPEHFHATIQIFIALESASCEVAWWTPCGERLGHTVGPGDIWILPPNVRHSNRWVADTSVLLLYLDPRWVKRFGEGLVDAVAIESISNFALHDPLFASLMGEIQRESNLGGLHHPPQLEALGQCLAARVLRGMAKRGANPPTIQRQLGLETMQRVTSFVNINLGEKISLAALAREARLSPGHFSVLFKATLGMTPEQYILRSRLLRAKGLIEGGAFTVGQVAYMTGFSDHSHLSVQFKRLFGVPPKLCLPQVRTS